MVKKISEYTYIFEYTNIEYTSINPMNIIPLPKQQMVLGAL